jgi:hypothetical protein
MTLKPKPSRLLKNIFCRRVWGRWWIPALIDFQNSGEGEILEIIFLQVGW